MTRRKFFKRYQGRGSYDLFSNYSHYAPGMKGMFGLLGLFILGGLLGNLISLGLNYISPSFAQDYENIITYPVMFIPAMLYASARSRLDENFTPADPLDQNNFGRFNFISLGLIVSFATIAAAFISDGMSFFLPPMPDSLKTILENMLNAPLWLTLLSVSVFAPFFEEWLCRGMILRGLLKTQTPLTAILVSATFFAVIHLNPWQAIPAFALGLLFGYVYYKTGSLKLTMLMHCVNNTLAAVMSRIPSLKDVDSFYEVLSPAAYIGIMICSIAFIAATLVFLKGLEIKRPSFRME